MLLISQIGPRIACTHFYSYFILFFCFLSTTKEELWIEDKNARLMHSSWTPIWLEGHTTQPYVRDQSARTSYLTLTVSLTRCLHMLQFFSVVLTEQCKDKSFVETFFHLRRICCHWYVRISHLEPGTFRTSERSSYKRNQNFMGLCFSVARLPVQWRTDTINNI